MTRRAWTAVPVGVVVGLTWAAGVRVWMAQLVGEGSTVGWLTLVLVLLPGAAVGGCWGGPPGDGPGRSGRRSAGGPSAGSSPSRSGPSARWS